MDHSPPLADELAADAAGAADRAPGPSTASIRATARLVGGLLLLMVALPAGVIAAEYSGLFGPAGPLAPMRRLIPSPSQMFRLLVGLMLALAIANGVLTWLLVRPTQTLSLFSAATATGLIAVPMFGAVLTPLLAIGLLLVARAELSQRRRRAGIRREINP